MNLIACIRGTRKDETVWVMPWFVVLYKEELKEVLGCYPETILKSSEQKTYEDFNFTD